MEFRVTKASDGDYEKTIEIETLEELLEFTNTYGDIILNATDITIYDDYVE